jgi:hypothetical protein
MLQNTNFIKIHSLSTSKLSNFHDVYELKNQLGQGANAVVKRAIRQSDGLQFAVKVIRTGDDERILSVRN